MLCLLISTKSCNRAYYLNLRSFSCQEKLVSCVRKHLVSANKVLRSSMSSTHVSSANFCPKGCEKLALAARGNKEPGFTQPLREKCALLSTLQRSVLKFLFHWRWNLIPINHLSGNRNVLIGNFLLYFQTPTYPQHPASNQIISPSFAEVTSNKKPLLE